MKNNDIIIIPDRLAHYRLPVFNNLAHIAEKLGYNLVIMADLRPDKTGIKKPSYISINNNNFKFVKSLDYRVLNRLILSTGSFKAIYSNARIIIIWGDASAIGNWIASIIIRLFTNKKLVFWSHGLYGNENRLVKTLRLRFYNMAHQILLYGNYSKSLLLSNGFDPNKLLVINNALDTTIQDELFNNNKLDFVSDVNKIRLLFVGRLTASKKIELLLSAVATLSKTHDVELNIIGDGSEMSNLRNLANDLNINNRVKFHGAIYDESILCKYFLYSDILVSPGNVGLSAMHSLVYGTPVISHDNPTRQGPEYESIINDFSGYLFKENDVKSLSNTIKKCKHSLNNNIINRQSCRSVITSKYSFEYQGKVFNELINRLEAEV